MSHIVQKNTKDFWSLIYIAKETELIKVQF